MPTLVTRIRAALARVGAAWIVALAPVVVFWEAVVGFRVVAPGDAYQNNIPWYSLAADSWRAGRVPAWNPFTFGGFPLLGAQQPAVFFPLTWLFVVLPPAAAQNAFVIISFAVAGTGGFFLGRRLLHDDIAALVTGLTFGLSGFMFGRVGHPGILAAAAWMPWALLGYELLRERITPWRALAAGLPLALAALAGASQVFATIVWVVGVYALMMALLGGRQAAVRGLVALAFALSIGIGLAAVQIVPALSFLDESSRQHVTFEQAMTYQFPKTHAPLLAFPMLFGNQADVGPFLDPYRGTWNLTELAGYPGMAGLVLAAAGIGAVRRDRRAWAILAIAVVALLLAFGKATPAAQLVYRLPLYGQMRAWARNIVAFDLAVALFAGWGVVALRSDAIARRRAAWLRAGAAAAAVAIAALVVPRLGFVRPFLPPEGYVVHAVAIPAAAALLAATLAIFARHRIVAGALCALVAADLLLSFGIWYEWRGGPLTPDVVNANDAVARAEWGRLEDSPGGIDRYLFLGSVPLMLQGEFPTLTDMRGMRSVNGADPLAPQRWLQLMGMAAFGGASHPQRYWRDGSDLLDVLRVTTLLIDPAEPLAREPSSDVTGPTEVAGVLRYEHQPAVEDAWLVGATQVRRFEDQVFILEGIEPFDPAEAALVASPCARCPGPGEPGATGRVLRREWHADRVEFTVEATRPSMLVVSQAWSDGWRADVDGRREQVVRADAVLQGVAVPAGRSTVVLEYHPPGLRAGAFASLTTVLGLVTWAFVDRRRRAVGARGEDPASVG